MRRVASNLNEVYFEKNGIVIKKFSQNLNDVPEVLTWLNDPRHVRFSNQRYFNHTEESQRAYIQSFEESRNLYLGAYKSKELVGTATMIFHDPNKVAEIGILVSNKKINEGNGTLIMNCILEYIENFFDIVKVRGGCLSCNLAMKKVFEKNGFYKEATLVDEEIFENSRINVDIYSKFTNRYFKK